MKRRTLLASLGSLTASSMFAVGSGAFTSISANRTVSVGVADDNRAFLRLEPITDSGLGESPTGRSGTFGGQDWFSIPGRWDGENQSAKGVGVDSIYEFHDLMRIENQGTQPVEVYSTYGGDTLANLALVRDSGVLRDDPPILDVGESVDVGLLINSQGTPVREMEYDETLTIVAVRPTD